MSDKARNWGLVAIVLGAAIGLNVGCEKTDSIAPFTGSVTYNGKPLEFGSVTFQPVAGGSIARAQIQPDGSFELDTDGRAGAPIGVNNVRVTCFANQRPGATQVGDGEPSLGKSLIPKRYARFSSSGLTVEVKSGENPPYKIELSD